MAEFGADVARSDIDIGRAQETDELLKKFGQRAIAIQADVSKPDEVSGWESRQSQSLVPSMFFQYH